MNDNKSEVYNFITESSSDGFRYINYVNGDSIFTGRLCEMFNIEKGKETDEELMKHVNTEDAFKVLKTREEAYRKKDLEFEAEYRLSDEKTWILHKEHIKYDASGNITEKCIFFSDITELKEKQIELEYMAYFDNVTGLYNRNYFIKRLEHAIEKYGNKDKRIQLLYIDIDNFNDINDSFGFEKGDSLITAFAAIFDRYTSHTVKVGRFNNDEFVMALYDAKSDNQIVNIYEEIIDILKKPIRFGNGEEVFISISAGISIYPDGKNATDLIKCANIAMNHVKQSGKNGMCIFSQDMHNVFVKNVKLEHMLKNAVIDESFYLNYQPQYYSECRKLRGLEALIRWKPNDEIVSPVDFIPIAERTGCIINIGKWVIRKAFADFAEWKNTYGYKGVISVNISAVQLKEKNFAQMVIEAMEEYGLEPNDIEIEITESVLIENYQEVIEVLSSLRGRGFRISLDDFGTGYSSLSYLKEMSIDTLKIDKSFVDTILTDKSTEIITDAVIKMVKKLGLETIAEGVETKEQYEYLKKIDCDNIQGFFLGRPMDKENIINLIIKENEKAMEKRSYV